MAMIEAGAGQFAFLLSSGPDGEQAQHEPGAYQCHDDPDVDIALQNPRFYHAGSPVGTTRFP